MIACCGSSKAGRSSWPNCRSNSITQNGRAQSKATHAAAFLWVLAVLGQGNESNHNHGESR